MLSITSTSISSFKTLIGAKHSNLRTCTVISNQHKLRVYMNTHAYNYMRIFVLQKWHNSEQDDSGLIARFSDE